MPYPPKKDRVDIDAVLSGLRFTEAPKLAYALVRLCVKYIKARQALGYPLNWAERMGVEMVMDDVKQEWHRRVVVPHHDAKKEENGDIFDDLA